jgi:hypothetical protein
MTQTIQKKIVNRIYGNGRGWAFSKIDFAGIGSDGSIRIALMRLEEEGTIRRVCRGIYDYPKYSDLLKSNLSPDFDQVARAIARKSGWTIRPSGAAALNLLGLSTQVPAKILYLSDGPTKTVEAAPWVIHFKNTALKEMKLKPKTSLMVQAIKSLGRDPFNDAMIAGFRKAFTEEERRQALKDAPVVSDWIYELIRKICAGENNG